MGRVAAGKTFMNKRPLIRLSARKRTGRSPPILPQMRAVRMHRDGAVRSLKLCVPAALGSAARTRCGSPSKKLLPPADSRHFWPNYLSQPAVNAPAAPATFMIKGGMLKTRMKRVADRGDHAVRRLAEIEASIADLSNEDLLDLADIFKAEPRSPIGDMAFV